MVGWPFFSGGTTECRQVDKLNLNRTEPCLGLRLYLIHRSIFTAFIMSVRAPPETAGDPLTMKSHS